MLTSSLDYDLPAELIAQAPAEPRDASRLLHVRRATGAIEHRVIRELPDLLRRGDVLVFNRTRVIPARLHGRKPTGGQVEVLLLRKIDGLRWHALVGGKRVNAVEFDGGLRARVAPAPGAQGAERVIEFDAPVEPHLERLGEMPLPPYIKQRLADAARYQTVYASDPGSAAAPTAGLHFTPDLLERLAQAGIQRAFVTLHVGLDTFKPIDEARIEDHRIHSEWCELPEESAGAINAARAAGGRVVAVGTTSVRVLESAAQDRRAAAFSGDTRLFITPGYTFKLVDAMITNFHLPRSTLLALVGAFTGMDVLRRAYVEAIAQRYRFYSFGDAMLLE